MCAKRGCPKGITKCETVAIQELVGRRMSQELAEPLTEKEIINVAIVDKERFEIVNGEDKEYRLWVKPSTEEGVGFCSLKN